LLEAVEIGVLPEVDITIPWDAKIPPRATTIILGNLLDNALAAINSHVLDKKLSISVKYRKNTVIITVINTYNGKIEKKTESLSA
jgi:sensor histidine kinase regulating citrate/malate metabolism